MIRKNWFIWMLLLTLVILVSGCGAKESDQTQDKEESFTESLVPGEELEEDLETDEEVQSDEVEEGQEVEISQEQKEELEYIISRLDYILADEEHTTSVYFTLNLTENQKLSLATLFYNDGMVDLDTSKVADSASFKVDSNVVSEYLKNAVGVGLTDAADEVTIQLNDYGAKLPYASIESIITASSNQITIIGEAGIQSDDGIKAYPFVAMGASSEDALFGGYMINEISINVEE